MSPRNNDTLSCLNRARGVEGGGRSKREEGQLPFALSTEMEKIHDVLGFTDCIRGFIYDVCVGLSVSSLRKLCKYKEIHFLFCF